MKNSRKIILIFAPLLIWQILPLKGQSFSDRQIRLKPVHYKLDIKIDYQKEKLSGTCELNLMNTTAQPVNKVPLILYRLMNVSSISNYKGEDLSYRQQVVVFEDFPKLQVDYIEVVLKEPLKKDETATLNINYAGYLLGYTETGMLYVKDHLNPEFTIIRPDSRAYPAIGVPCLAVNRKAGLTEFDYEINVTVPDSLVVVNSGILTSRKVESDQVTYSYKSAKPVWRIDIPIANYGLLEENERKVFYLAEDSLRAGTIMQAINSTMELFQDWFGPLHNQGGFTLIEIPDGWGSQTTEGCIIQSAEAFKEDQRLYELYHEISHLWNAPKTDPQPPRWEEGLAMFLQYLTIEKLEHRPALNRNANGMLQRVRKILMQQPQLQNVAMINYGMENAAGLSYTAGMLFFYTLYSVVGESDFLDIMGSFYQKYYDTGATTEEFIDFVKKHAAMDLTRLFDDWFYRSTYSRYIISASSIDNMIKEYNR